MIEDKMYKCQGSARKREDDKGDIYKKTVVVEEN